jgi:hypothetical protein
MDGKPSASRSDGLGAAMNSELASDDGKACFAKRQQTIEPVFGQIKELQGTAVPALGLAACTPSGAAVRDLHLLKLWRPRARPPAAS